ncbi:hypothetical protein EDB84DRAFT_1622822, partial [Lactarius hengduanensis]
PPQSTRIDAATVTTHILGLSSDERQHVISNLLLMSGSDLDSDSAAEHINALEFDFDPIFAVPDSPPPRPPRSPHCPSSPRIAPPPLPVVEDDNTLRGGIKSAISSPTSSIFHFPSPIDEPPHPDRHSTTALTTDNTDEFNFEAFYTSYMRDNHLSKNLAVSVSSLTDRRDNEKVLHNDISTHPRPQRYADIFPCHTFEQPRNPDKVTPATTHEHSCANAAEPTPCPPNAGPTQVHGIQLALQQPASYLTCTFTRIPQNVLRINSAWPSPQTDPPSTPASTTQQDPDEVTRNRDRQTRRTQPVPPSDPVATQLSRHIDNTQHPLVRTRRQQPHIRTSQNQDRHAHTKPPRTA